ncbi:MAG: GIY-YIG nuclease family protein [Pseudomonadota bacterium]
MPIFFHTIIREAGLPVQEVRLVRHKDKNADRGRSPYELWRDNRSQFETYQSLQSFHDRKKLNVKYWAVFVVTSSDETMFAGVYRVEYEGLLKVDTPSPHMEGVIDKAESCDKYNLILDSALHDLIGRLIIDWGDGKRAWIQYAYKNTPDFRPKPIIELRPSFKEPDFPGYLSMIKILSELTNLPNNWIAALKSSRGVYLLTCPRTKEQYVGSASGEEGFWGRWQEYIQTGHGGNIGLKSREPSDYQVSILEVAGSSATTEDILNMEGRWQDKLQSQAMGLNRNRAGRSQY